MNYRQEDKYVKPKWRGKTQGSNQWKIEEEAAITRHQATYTKPINLSSTKRWRTFIPLRTNQANQDAI